MPFFTEELRSFPLPFLFDFCKCHHWTDSLTLVFTVLGSSFWFLQELPSAGPKPRKLENTGTKCFSSVLLLTSLKCSVHTSQALDHTSTAQMSLPTAPVTAQLPRPCHYNIPHAPDYNKTPGVVISPLYFPHHKQSKLGNFPARQACWAAERAEVKCWKTEGKTWGDQHVKKRLKDACNLNNLNSQQFQSL